MVTKHFIVAALEIKRIRNIVRQAFNAYMSDIISLLARNFSVFVILSFLAAIPIAWFAVNNMGQDMVYSFSLIGWIVSLSGVGMLLITLIILNIRTIRSAFDNPVKAFYSI